MEERLQKFVKLVDVGSFTKAAEKMRLSQPALTVAIAKLERELGAQLLLRESRPIELTTAGQIAYKAGTAQAVVLDNLRTELADLTGRRLSVAIGLVDSVAATLFARATPLTELEKETDVSVIVNDSRSLQKSIDERLLDIAVVVSANDKSKHFADELMLLVSAPHIADAQKTKLQSGILNDFISYDQPSRTTEIIKKNLKSRGIDIESRLKSSSPEVICRMVVSGTGVAVLPYVVVRSLLITKALTLLTMNDEPITIVRPLDLLQLPGKKQADAVRHFTDEMRTVLVASYNEAKQAVAKS